MSINVAGLNVTRDPNEVEIKDRDNEGTGLFFKILPKTASQFQREFNKAKQTYQKARGKSLSPSKQEEVENRLLMARIDGWRWTGKALENQGGEQPEFNRANLKAVLFDFGEDSVGIRMALQEAIEEFDQGFLDE